MSSPRQADESSESRVRRNTAFFEQFINNISPPNMRQEVKPTHALIPESSPSISNLQLPVGTIPTLKFLHFFQLIFSDIKSMKKFMHEDAMALMFEKSFIDDVLLDIQLEKEGQSEANHHKVELAFNEVSSELANTVCQIENFILQNKDKIRFDIKSIKIIFNQIMTAVNPIIDALHNKSITHYIVKVNRESVIHTIVRAYMLAVLRTINEHYTSAASINPTLYDTADKLILWLYQEIFEYNSNHDLCTSRRLVSITQPSQEYEIFKLYLELQHYQSPLKTFNTVDDSKIRNEANELSRNHVKIMQSITSAIDDSVKQTLALKLSYEDQLNLILNDQTTRHSTRIEALPFMNETEKKGSYERLRVELKNKEYQHTARMLYFNTPKDLYRIQLDESSMKRLIADCKKQINDIRLMHERVCEFYEKSSKSLPIQLHGMLEKEHVKVIYTEKFNFFSPRRSLSSSQKPLMHNNNDEHAVEISTQENNKSRRSFGRASLKFFGRLTHSQQSTNSTSSAKITTKKDKKRWFGK